MNSTEPTTQEVEIEALKYCDAMDENLKRFQDGEISRAEFSRSLEKLIANRSAEVSQRYRQIQYSRAASQ
jgi:hypothetical protein